MELVKYCTKCGQKLGGTAKFCTACGAPCLDMAKTDAEITNEKDKIEKQGDQNPRTYKPASMAVKKIIIPAVVIVVAYLICAPHITRYLDRRSVKKTTEAFLSAMKNNDVLNAVKYSDHRTLDVLNKEMIADDIEYIIEDHFDDSDILKYADRERFKEKLTQMYLTLGCAMIQEYDIDEDSIEVEDTIASVRAEIQGVNIKRVNEGGMLGNEIEDLMYDVGYEIEDTMMEEYRKDAEKAGYYYLNQYWEQQLETFCSSHSDVINGVMEESMDKALERIKEMKGKHSKCEISLDKEEGKWNVEYIEADVK